MEQTFWKDNMYVEVLLPLAISHTYTYSVPGEYVSKIKIGARVEVQFGQRRHYTAIVKEVRGTPPEHYRVKPILDVLDDEPVVTHFQLKFWEWIADYYMCTMGEVMQAALPAQLKLESSTIFSANQLTDINILDLEDDEYLVASALSQQYSLSLEDIQQILQRKHVVRTVKHLLDLGVMLVSEVMTETYKPRKKVYVQWAEKYRDNEELQKNLLDDLVSRPQQLNILMAFYDLARSGVDVSKTELLKRADVSPGVLQTLTKNNVFELVEKEVTRLSIPGVQENIQHSLSASQQEVLKEVDRQFLEKDVVLLFGITASGKTHIYIERIQQAIREGKQVLFLLPEIALTAQLISRLNTILGGVGVYHSRLSQAERTEVWLNVLNRKVNIVVGARSALFLPFTALGLVIVDEEHDQSYKQQEPAPRYQARDAAMILSRIQGAKIILGSATPSVETYYLASQGRFGLVKMDTPFHTGGSMSFSLEPLVRPRSKEPVGATISPVVREKVEAMLEAKKQVIVFQNRRGYAPFLLCSTCGWVPYCKNCDVPLTYHKHINKLKCHYCGYVESPPPACKACASTGIIQRGVGTEKIEDEMQVMFPKARIARLDQDAVRTKHGHTKITRDFEDHELDILIGTQMIAKGLDFSEVGLVVVPDVDSLLYYPDFRATERAFQLLYQVSGRTGRRNVEGEVSLQTARKDHPVLQWVMKRDYESFYREEIKVRQEYIYPPFCRLCRFTFFHKDKTISREAAVVFAAQAGKQKSIGVLGPAEPSVGKIKNLFLHEVLIKMPRSSEVQHIKSILRQIIDKLQAEAPFKQVKVVPDIDPY